MATKALLTATILALTPMAGFAMCTGHKETQASTCAQGMVFDTETGTCKVVSG